MPTVAQVVTPLANAHNSLYWMVGIVSAVNTTTRKLSVQFRGQSGSASTPGVDYVMSYSPAVGDKVHAISAEERGILVLGTTGPSPAQMMAPMAMRAAAAPPDACAVPEGTGTHVRLGNEADGFRSALVAQGLGLLGVWTMPDLANAIQAANALGLVVGMEIELTLLHGATYAMLTLVTDSPNPQAVGTPYLSRTLTVNEPTRVRLPLGWLDALGDGLCMIGLSNADRAPQAGFSVDACVYLTVETV